mgnify:CR=1 FL=1
MIWEVKFSEFAIIEKVKSEFQSKFSTFRGYLFGLYQLDIQNGDQYWYLKEPVYWYLNLPRTEKC